MKGYSITTTLKKNRILVIGLLLLVITSLVQITTQDTLKTMRECYSPNNIVKGAGAFPSGATLTRTCSYEKDIGQDLIFWAKLHGDSYNEPIPVRLQIRDPNNHLIIDEEFNSSIVTVNVRPQIHGEYVASLTSFQNKSKLPSSSYLKYQVTAYFGHLTSHYAGVSNPLGSMIAGLAFWSVFFTTPAWIMILYGIVKLIYKGMKSRKGLTTR